MKKEILTITIITAAVTSFSVCSGHPTPTPSPRIQRSGEGELDSLIKQANKQEGLSDFIGCRETCLRVIKILENSKTSMQLASMYGKLGKCYNQLGDWNEAIVCYEKAYDIWTINKSNPLARFFVVAVHNNIGNTFQDQERFDDALRYFNKGLAMFDKLDTTGLSTRQKEGIPSLHATFLINIAECYTDMAKSIESIPNCGCTKKQEAIALYNKALECLQLAFNLQTQNKDTDGLSYTLGNMGTSYKKLCDKNKAMKYFEQGLEIQMSIGRKEGMINNYVDIASLQVCEGKFKQAEANLKNAEAIAETMQHKYIKEVYLGLYLLYKEWGISFGEIKKSTPEQIRIFRQGFIYTDKLRQKEQVLYDEKKVQQFANTEAKFQNRLNEAQNQLTEKELQRQKEEKLRIEGEKLLAEKEAQREREERNRSEKEQEVLRQQKKIDDLLIAQQEEDKKLQALELKEGQKNILLLKQDQQLKQATIEREKATRESAQAEAETEKAQRKSAELERQSAETEKRNIMFGGSAFVLLLGGIAMLIWRNWRTEKRSKQRIEAQNHQLAEQKAEIVDSITYAQRIQSAMLFDPSDVQELFPDSFILYLPKDIVSGDFYWFSQVEDTILFAAVDCTGHGVPGAMMSMLGNDVLNSAVRDGLSDPGEILNYANVHINAGLRKEKRGFEKVMDGMDLTLCAYNTKNHILTYAGANNPFYLIRNGELIKYSVTRKALGTKDALFESSTIELQPDDRIYLMSDGYRDQFGGEKGKKFTPKKFEEAVLAMHTLPMEQQGEILKNTMDEWKRGKEQIDDITVLGIRFVFDLPSKEQNGHGTHADAIPLPTHA